VKKKRRSIKPQPGPQEELLNKPFDFGPFPPGVYPFYSSYRRNHCILPTIDIKELKKSKAWKGFKFTKAEVEDEQEGS
jgi:hypothetical protein